jgi:hypothetical protein
MISMRMKFLPTYGLISFDKVLFVLHSEKGSESRGLLTLDCGGPRSLRHVSLVDIRLKIFDGHDIFGDRHLQSCI